MYLHKTDKETFQDILNLVSDRTATNVEIIEKDYYVTMILKELAKAELPIVFKGGTSLSKAFHVIDRFSEDIDITFTEHLGAGKRKRLKYNIMKPLEEQLGLSIQNWGQIESDRNYNHYDFSYESVLVHDVGTFLSSFVKLETVLMSYSFPTE